MSTPSTDHATHCDCNYNAPSTTTPQRTLPVEILYIDINTCDRCQGAAAVLKDAIALLREPLELMGVRIALTESLVETAEQAAAARLVTSPSIRVAGRDIQPELRESDCNACGALPNQSRVDCRVWAYQGKDYTVPPPGLVIAAIMAAALDPDARLDTSADSGYALPDNLKSFFDRKMAGPSVRACC